jgi:hypothetical protein
MYSSSPSNISSLKWNPLYAINVLPNFAIEPPFYFLGHNDAGGGQEQLQV